MSLMDNLVYLSGKYRVQRTRTCKRYSPARMVEAGNMERMTGCRNDKKEDEDMLR